MGGNPDPGGSTVAGLLDDHLEQQPLAASSRAEYRRARKLHLPAAFEARAVAGVTPPVIDALYRQLEAADVSPHQIRKLHSLLSGAFKRAVRWGWVPSNPCRDAAVPGEPEPDTYTPDSAEVRRLLAACDDIAPAFGVFCRVAANTGARRGEVLALQRGDIDLEAGEVTYVRGVSRDDGRAYVGPLKTGKRGRRTVAIAPGLVARITAHLFAQDLEATDLDIELAADTWLFTEDYHSPWYPTTPGHWWARARAAAGIGRVRIYDLRHYVATELFAAGFDEQTTMRRLGHTNPVTTGKRYATSRPARDRDAAERLERELGP